MLNKKFGHEKFELKCAVRQATNLWISVLDLDVKNAFISTTGLDMYNANAAFDHHSTFSLEIPSGVFVLYDYPSDKEWNIGDDEKFEFRVFARIGQIIWRAYKEALKQDRYGDSRLFTPEHVIQLYGKK